MLELSFIGCEDTLGSQHVVTAKLSQKVNQTGATETDRRNIADGLVVHIASDRIHAKFLDSAVICRHAVFHQSALKSRSGWARRNHHAAAVADEHFGVGAHIYKHDGFRALGGDIQRCKARSEISADMTRHKRHAVYPGARVGQQAELARGLCQRRTGPLAGREFMLNKRFIRSLSD